MNVFETMISQLTGSYSNPQLSLGVILSVILAVLLLTAFEIAVYRLVSRRTFYNRAFSVTLAAMPFFISAIILSLQSSLVITLGTIGALAILRFRTAVKDPVDMLYLLWSVFIGITAGCQLYELAAVTSLVVTVVLLALGNVRFGKAPMVLVLHCEADKEAAVLAEVKKSAKNLRIKSRNYTEKGVDLVAQAAVKDEAALAEAVRTAGATRFSVMAYDSDDVL